MKHLQPGETTPNTFLFPLAMQSIQRMTEQRAQPGQEAPAGEPHVSPAMRTGTRRNQGQVLTQILRNLPLPPDERPRRSTVASSAAPTSLADSPGAGALEAASSCASLGTHFPESASHFPGTPANFFGGPPGFLTLGAPPTVSSLSASGLSTQAPVVESYFLPFGGAPTGRLRDPPSSTAAPTSGSHVPVVRFHLQPFLG